MRTCLVTAVLVLVLACPGLAQSPAQTPDVPIWYANQNTVRLHIDLPQDGGWTAREAGRVALHGWAWNCNGSPVDLRVWRADADTQTYVQVAGVTVEPTPRPDVLAAFAGLPCAMSTWSGYVLRVPLDVGTHQLVVQGYAPGGVWHPVTGLFMAASATRRVHVVVVEGVR